MGKILIAGGTGLIGSMLSQELAKGGHEVQLLSRRAGPQAVVWDGRTLGAWVATLDEIETVINLCGRSISTKFSAANQQEILDSRVGPTRLLGDAIAASGRDIHWINASAVGFYGNRGDEILTETSAAGSGFLAETCARWEEAILGHPVPAKKSVVRIGVVIDANGGALVPLGRLARLFLGGHAGSGEQYVSWVDSSDLIALFSMIVERGAEGVFNGSAPTPVTNREQMATMRGVLGRPWSPPIPEFVMRMIGKLVGPDASLVLDSTRAIPSAALAAKFEFRMKSLSDSLAHHLRDNSKS